MARLTTSSLVLILIASCATPPKSQVATMSPAERAAGFQPLFDGKTLRGWNCDVAYWSVQDGMIVGQSPPPGLAKNTFAMTRRSFSDFILRWKIKLPSSNSGVQFRSRHVGDYEVAGYQADCVIGGWGNLHDQNGRGRLVDGWTDKAERVVKPDEWVDMEVDARGPHIIIRTNGIVTADYTETDPNAARSGIIALQLHRGDPMTVYYKDLRIKMLE